MKRIESAVYRWIAARLPNRLIYWTAIQSLTYGGAPDNRDVIKQLEVWTR